MKKIFLLITVLFAFAAGTAFAQESPEGMAKKYNIQFPIAELGNCTDISSCKAYCDDEANRDTCMNFAKKKGFHKEIKRPDDTILQSAKSTLGCDSEAACRSICEKEENFEKCSSFAQKHGLGGGPRGNPGGANILQKAKEILGCDSEASCKSICENPENQQKCSDFAKQAGLGGGIRKVGPGGCNSEESCRSYCQTHQEECMKFGGDRPEGADSQRRGPGGCDSEASCQAYCESHEEECAKFGGNSSEGRDGGRKGPGGCSGEESCMEYCKSHPDECKNFGGQGPGGEGKEGQFNMRPEDMKREYNKFPQRPSGTQGFQPPEQYQNEGYKQGEQKTVVQPTPETSFSYPTPIYGTPTYTYPTPSTSYSYPTPNYATPSQGTSSYGTPSETYSYPTPNAIQGTSAFNLGRWARNLWGRHPQ